MIHLAFKKSGRAEVDPYSFFKFRPGLPVA
jgi:hypothetical protein